MATASQTEPTTASVRRFSKPGVETIIALAATVFSAVLLISSATYTGPLWRDEVNTINVAQMPSLHELLNNEAFESFPPLYPLLLRGCGLLGMLDGDSGIRVVGLYVALLFLASVWLTTRWLGCRGPIFSIALLGSLPSFIFIIGENRAYGLASCLLVLSFGTIWRMLQSLTAARTVAAGVICALFAHCVYYDIVFLCAMLGGGALVTIRRRHWKTLGALAVIGFVCSSSLAIYLPIIHRGAPFMSMMQWPDFNFLTLWGQLGDTLTPRSSGEMGRNGPEIWLWVGLILAGLLVALLMQRRAPQQASVSEDSAIGSQIRADRSLFCGVSMFLGVIGLFIFLMRLHYLTQSWYYIEMLCLCTVALDGLLGANWPALRPGGLVRVGFLLVMMGLAASPGWKESHTRRSDVDLIAAALGKNVSQGDLIVVQSAWEGITFNRYYHGKADWVTVPPVDSHLVHRNDLIFAQMSQTNSMAPVLLRMADTLRSGHYVWLLGNMTGRQPTPPPAGLASKSFEACYSYWSAQVSAMLLSHALQEQVLEIPAGAPVCYLENLPVIRFAGYKSGMR